ncbi:cyanophycin synthetase, partial [Gordonia sp. i37]|uniref:glutamate ligase domain-containing protein n=1 Tax=Gordonia sp. i37 TaxID=1961707 RepID=UPI0009D01DD9
PPPPPPADGELGVRDGELVDRAFGEAGGVAGVGMAAGTALADAAVIRPPGPSGLADALAAAALARSIGITPDPIRSALAAFRPAAHRGEVVAERDGIAFVDDSKATNPHAAQAAIAAHRRVVLIAGGLLKGASLASMLDAVADRLAGVVAIGRDRELVVAAIARHAPEVPTVTVFTGDDGCVTVQRELSFPSGVDLPAAPGASGAPGTSDVSSASGSVSVPAPAGTAVAVMDRAVHVAWSLAAAHRGEDRPDAILLAPAAASLDMFAGYGRRGDAFADAARSLAGEGGAVDAQAQRR